MVQADPDHSIDAHISMLAMDVADIVWRTESSECEAERLLHASQRIPPEGPEHAIESEYPGHPDLYKTEKRSNTTDKTLKIGTLRRVSAAR